MRVVAFLFLILFGGIAAAQDSLDLYRVQDIAVSVKAASAAEAKEQAFMQAQRQALEALAFRLGAEGAGEGLSDEDLGSLIQSFEVQKENPGPGRYAGVFTFQFRPLAVRDLLKDAVVDESGVPRGPVVVLPILVSGGRIVLWEEVTPWREAWQEVAAMSGRVPLIVPMGDVEDVAMIGSREALAGIPENIKTLASKYEARGVAVVLLRSERDPLGFWGPGEVDVYRYGEDGQVYEPIVRVWPGSGGATQARMDPRLSLKDEAKKTAGQALLSWDVGLVAETPEETRPQGGVFVLSVSVPVPTVADWTRIKSKLVDVPVIIRTNVSSMARGKVYAEITFQGDVSSLKASLARQELTLIESEPGRWELQDSEGDRS